MFYKKTGLRQNQMPHGQHIINFLHIKNIYLTDAFNISVAQFMLWSLGLNNKFKNSFLLVLGC